MHKTWFCMRQRAFAEATRSCCASGQHETKSMHVLTPYAPLAFLGETAVAPDDFVALYGE